MQDELLLASKVSVLRILLDDPAKTGALESEIEHEAGEGHAAKYYLQVVRPDGRMLIETHGMTSLLPAGIFPQPPSAASGESAVVEYRQPANRDFLLLTARATTGAPELAPRTLHIARDITFNRAILANCRRRLLIVFGVGTAVAAIAGFLVARAGLLPVREIAVTT